MKFDKRFGYTLAEIMVVLLVLSIIFAAFAPLITRRRATADRSKYAVWNWVAGSQNSNGNAYFDTGDKRGTLFFGLSPETKGEVESKYLPNSKVVIRSLDKVGNGQIQRQIQFRYGAAGLNTSGSPKDKFTGSWLMDGRNILLGGEYPKMTDNSSLTNTAKNNIAIGTDALNNLSNGSSTSPGGKNNIALGYQAGKEITNGQDNVLIGTYAGQKGASNSYRTFVGSLAGSSNTGNYNTAIGYSAGRKTTAENNTYIGAHAGEGGVLQNYAAKNNFAQGYNALKNITDGTYNVAVGSGALEKLTSGNYNVAIGLNACSNVTTGSNKTCIGANSGPQENSTAQTYLYNVTGTDARTDDVERTYIGGQPKEFRGDAVLEIHNPNTTNSHLVNNPTIKGNTTTIINGNLIVRGNLYITSGNGLLYKLNYNNNVNNDNNGYLSAISPETDDPIVSDRRLKNIGKRNNNGLDKISQLKIFNYNFKADKSKKPQVGVIAQELQKVFPNSVFKGEDGYLRIKWDEMFFASVNALKEIDKKIILLTKRLTNLEPKITKLEQQNAELKLQIAQLTARIESLKK